jgi:hypothetical protein
MNPTEIAEIYEKLVDLSEVRISEAGGKRIHNIIHITNLYESLNRTVISKDGGLAGMVTLLLKDGIEGGGEMEMHNIHSDMSKDMVALHIHRKAEEKSYDALVTVAEVWIASVDDCENVGVRPSQMPDRKEAVMTSVHINIGFSPCVVTILQPIIRIGRASCLGESDIQVMRASDVVSRLSGIESRLCPIT